MRMMALLTLALGGCQTSQPAERYGFIARLGNDTVSAESVTRRADTVVSDEVDRFPRMRRIAITSADARHGALVMSWGTFRWTAPIVVP